MAATLTQAERGVLECLWNALKPFITDPGSANEKEMREWYTWVNAADLWVSNLKVPGHSWITNPMDRFRLVIDDLSRSGITMQKLEVALYYMEKIVSAFCGEARRS